eukprot:gene15288-biopygen6894
MKISTTDAVSPATASKPLGFYHCVLLALAITLGGLASSLWHYFLLSGIYAGLVMFLVLSFAYSVLLMSLSELVGIVPFSGGNFGFVRCALGPFWGYLAACMEFLYYCMYNARSLTKISLLVEAAGDFHPDLQPLWAFLSITFIVIMSLRGGLTFWSLMMLATLFTIVILAIFYVGAYSHLDFKGYGLGYNYTPQYHNDGFIGNEVTFVGNIVRAITFYVGLDVLPLCSLRVSEASQVIPRALMTSFGVVFVLSLLAIVGVACHYPGVHPSLTRTTFVLQYGLSDAINMNPERFPLLLIPPTLASCAGYVYASGNQLAAMSESGLMPKLLQPRYGTDQIPVVSMVACGVMQFVVYYMVYLFAPHITFFLGHLTVLSATSLFILVCLSFIAFRIKFSSMTRNFVSPLGIPGAACAALFWAFIVVVNSNDQVQSHSEPIKAFYIFVAIVVAYYFIHVRHVQFFSKEEQEKFMKAYVLNANRQRRGKSGLPRSMLVRWRRAIGAVLRRSAIRNSYSSDESSSSNNEQKHRVEDVSTETISSVVKVRPVLSGIARSVHSLGRTLAVGVEDAVASVSNEFYPIGDAAVVEDRGLETAPPAGHLEMHAEEEAPLSLLLPLPLP